LTDDLLKLISITRTDLNIRKINLCQMISDIYADYQSKQPKRRVKLICPCELFAEGDTELVYILLNSLMDNAWKFTRQKRLATIEFGCFKQENKVVYYLRDNGLGFNMAYVQKLFGVFQRLHSHAEFEGTGIGLALAQLIIHRHGGTIWAEGKVKRGATFYFTLGPVL